VLFGWSRADDPSRDASAEAAVFTKYRGEVIFSLGDAERGIGGTMTKPLPEKVGYGLHISTDIERRLARCRVSIQGAVRDRLQEIAAVAGKGSGRVKRSAPKEPAFRFYIHDSYRVFYQVDPVARRIVVLDFAPA
jgi:mRNA-degrading endonuclease RelE of RelBE toxin-antitoxin system